MSSWPLALTTGLARTLVPALLLAGSGTPLSARAQLDLPRPAAAEAAPPSPKHSAGAAQHLGKHPPDRSSEPSLLLLEVRLDGSLLHEALTAYEVGGDLLLPVGELARLLSLGISVDPATRTAAGFVLQEDRPFRLTLDGAGVHLRGGATGAVDTAVDPTLVRWMDDDLYVASRLLQRWWPVDLALSHASLSLKVLPRETLPVQARLARERAAGQLLGHRGGGETDRGYPRAEPDYRWASVPFMDHTLGLQTSRSRSGQTSTRTVHSTLITGDLLGMEAALFVNNVQDQGLPEARLTLSRHDPQAGLLGPLRARSLALGHVAMPALANMMRGTATGNGFFLSNRPLNLPSSYGAHQLRGSLPPGWDVTLYVNEALTGFVQARSDGLYEFEEQPLVFGRNEFRLVFKGPLGQTRVEREVFLLDQTLTPPGELYYSAGAQRGDDGHLRQSVQIDMGLADNLAATVGLAAVNASVNASTQGTTRPPDAPRHYAGLGLRASTAGMLLSADVAQARGGGHLFELGVRTALLGFSLDATHTRLNGFVSDFFAPSSDPLRTRERVRINGSVVLAGSSMRLPLGLDVLRELTTAGRKSYNAQFRLSLNLGSTSFTSGVNWQSAAGSASASSTLQMSRRVAGVGLSSQLAYSLKPVAKVASLAVLADQSLSLDGRLSLGLVRSLRPSQTLFFAAYTRHLGRFGLGVSGRYSRDGELGVGLQLFMALGRDPRTGRWLHDGQPMAGAGMVSARAFLDENMNGRFDAGEAPVPGVGFIMNGGGRHPVRTDSAGTAHLGRLAPRAYTDVGLDTATLEDPQWQPLVQGVRVLPRPGKVQMLEFPVVMAGEVDGTVYLLADGQPRGIGNAEVELVDLQGVVAVSTRSNSDGYYILEAVKPGHYRLRINPAQLDKLRLQTAAPVALQMRGDGDFINAMDFVLSKKP